MGEPRRTVIRWGWDDQFGPRPRCLGLRYARWTEAVETHLLGQIGHALYEAGGNPPGVCGLVS